MALLLSTTTALLGLLVASPNAVAVPTSPTAPSTESSSTSEPSPAGKRATPGPACTTNADAVTPVICLPDGSGEDRTGRLVIGGDIQFAAQIVNNGPAVSDAELVITLPAQLRLATDYPALRFDRWYDDAPEDDEGTGLDCTASADGRTVTCATGPLAANENTLAVLDLQATSAARAGTTATFAVALQPQTEGAFPVTSVAATVAFLLPSRLSVTVNPEKAKVVVGRSKDLTVTVRNLGAGEAPDTFAITLLTSGKLTEDAPSDPHFTITNAPPEDEQFPVGVPVAGARQATVFTARSARAAKDDEVPLAFWPVGTVAPGATARFTVSVQALRAGTDTLLVGAFTSTQAQVECDIDSTDDDPACPRLTTASLTAVRAPATTAAPTAPSSSGPAPAAADAPIANTGLDDLTAELLLGTVLLLAGLGLVAAGRNTYRGRH